ncbi:bifunctional alpha,alpha-trehalose-phosphate synthase (UDP-forming)/trehalose-phosphatase [Leucobacter weissii]|uniref:Glucosylglycerol-phosphate synthase n=1 Tax=Leucobacter weissii TaxID=1983706 RepID=A0A939SB34_9MICO|nr:bifunctional alpha,alpha-trehalose-phosphate synthase (UDP-forming)/trehalose-phosphatase [Leucobacter weissii]MBO1901003.1 bifunctional alpha,alpha-trehalose-phosphate synthase (UDP-forming)/trehalose-phosphatase [Leucobacter weissii]
MPELTDIVGGREIVVVANRLPVDRVVETDGTASWRTSPGGLVTAMEPVVRELGCLWVGWSGGADEDLPPFEAEGMRLVPVPLSGDDLEGYYEGFANGTLWPLYHDVIAQPGFHREWWESYERVNRRFAEVVAHEAPRDAIVWVHDYQLQLVPALLRALRPDLTIAFFLHIPFPARPLFAQLPWRREIVEGLLGADVVGFQREQDAASFRAAAERYADALAHGNLLRLSAEDDDPSRSVLAQEFPISIDADAFAALATRPEVRRRAEEIREELGNPRTVLLGVDRLDYTKGIRHRLKAFAELLDEGEVTVGEAALVQVASPSRERVAAYRRLREEVERTVGRINGEHGSIAHTPVVYLHQGFSREEMAALYLAADVLVVTALRDGMNLVAKEYVACRSDELGVLVLSEFTGAADELRRALLVNPHDIEGMKAAFLRAIHMPEKEQQRRMRGLRAVVQGNDVRHWAENFLRASSSMAEQRAAADTSETGAGADSPATGPILLSASMEGSLRRFATAPELIVACDFDGTLAPIVSHPGDARIIERSQRALSILQQAPGVHVVLISGRSVEDLLATGIDTDGWIVSGSHGIELVGLAPLATADPGAAGPRGAAARFGTPLSPEESDGISALGRRLARIFGREPGVRLEPKPFGIAVHTRQVRDEERSDDILDAATRIGAEAGYEARNGKRVREFSARLSDKGSALGHIRSRLPDAPVLFLGDDVTDEDVFRTLEVDDLGVKVGAGDTAARARIADPEAVSAVLARLAELRTGIVIGSEPTE